MHRLPLLLLCLLPYWAALACAGVSRQQDRELASYQSNAQIYFENGNFDQAWNMVERGLLIDPDDYKLRALKGAILLRRSGPPLGDEHANLDASLQEFTEIYDWRAPVRHDHYVLVCD
jgi:tetratricopeptide (TPR) repeat protein